MKFLILCVFFILSLIIISSETINVLFHEYVMSSKEEIIHGKKKIFSKIDPDDVFWYFTTLSVSIILVIATVISLDKNTLKAGICSMIITSSILILMIFGQSAFLFNDKFIEDRKGPIFIYYYFSIFDFIHCMILLKKNKKEGIIHKLSVKDLDIPNHKIKCKESMKLLSKINNDLVPELKEINKVIKENDEYGKDSKEYEHRIDRLIELKRKVLDDVEQTKKKIIKIESERFEKEVSHLDDKIDNLEDLINR